MQDPKELWKRLDNINNLFLKEELENLKKIEPQVKEDQYLNLGIFYGLMLGILGNFLVTLLYNLFIESASIIVKFTGLVISLILLTIVLYLIIRKSKITANYYNVRNSLEYHIIPKIEEFKEVLAGLSSQSQRNK